MALSLLKATNPRKRLMHSGFRMTVANLISSVFLVQTQGCCWIVTRSLFLLLTPTSLAGVHVAPLGNVANGFAMRVQK